MTDKMMIDELIEKLRIDAIDLEHNDLLTRELGDAAAFQCRRIADMLESHRHALKAGMQGVLRFKQDADMKDLYWIKGLDYLLSKKEWTEFCEKNRLTAEFVEATDGLY